MNQQEIIRRAELETAAADRIDRAKLQIITRREFAFWGDILKRQFVVDWSIPTGCTDGTTIWYNPQFIAGLTMGQIMFLLAHEVIHIKSGHHLRGKGHDPMVSNQAADYVVNDLLKMVGMEFIPEVLWDIRYRDLSYEQVYSQLAQQQQQQQQQPGQGQGQDQDQQQPGQGQGAAGQPSGDDQTQGNSPGQAEANGAPAANYEPFKGDIMSTRAPAGFDELSEPEQQQVRDEQEQIARRDNSIAKQAGTMPGAMASYFDQFGVTQQNWKAIIADFALSRANNSYDWNTFNKQHSARGIFLPDRGGVQMGNAGIFVDVSGSVDHPQLQRFFTEVNDIVANCEIEETIVIQVNSRVKQVDEYQEGDEISPQINSGGGTCFRPPFEYLEEHDIEPEFVVYFTDGDCHTFADEPDYPVLWVLSEPNKRFDPPYGEVVTMDEA